MVMGKGLIILYTGDGKGKTCAALGTAFRAIGHECRVCMIQFIKGTIPSGELQAVKRVCDLMDIFPTGEGFIWSEEDIDKNRETAQRAWEFAKEAIRSGKYDVVILDELTYLLNFGLIDEREAVEFLKSKPESMHLIITGRDAPRSLIDAAEIVTEMREIKHPLDKGIKAQRGIDY